MGHVLSMFQKPSTTVIIPTFNEQRYIARTVRTIHQHKTRSVQIIVSDGHSTDATLRRARRAGARTMRVRGGRAAQLNGAAAAARADTVLFLHADTQVPPRFDAHVADALARPGAVAGAFSLSIDAPGCELRLVERIANWRARVLQAPYGDQGLFLSKRLFDRLGGFKLMPFLEDYEITRRLSTYGRIYISPHTVSTSARRWQTLGVVPTTLINQCVIVAYHCGVPVHTLRNWYRQALTRAAQRNQSRNNR